MRDSKLGRVLAAAFAVALVGCLALALPAAEGAKKKTVTKSFSNGVGGSIGGAALPIPNPAAGQPNLLVRSPITVKGLPKLGKIRDVNVGVRLDHPADSEIEIYLSTPRGVIDLSSDNGSPLPPGDYGTGADSCAGTFTTFDSQAPTAVTGGSAPFSGSFIPEESLTTLNNLKGNKANRTTWTLIVLDDFNNPNAGTLFCWKLDIKASKPPQR